MTTEVNQTGSGGMKYDEGKPRPGLLFKYAMAGIRGVIAVLEFGAKKYAPGSWVTVPNGEERYFEAAQRHFMDIQEHGLNHVDEESGLLSLDHLLCDLLFIRQLIANHKEDEEEVSTFYQAPVRSMYTGLLGDNAEVLTARQYGRYWELVHIRCGVGEGTWLYMTEHDRHDRIMAKLRKEEMQ